MKVKKAALHKSKGGEQVKFLTMIKMQVMLNTMRY